jgi:ribonuclease E
VKLYKDPQPLFTRYGIESQLDAMFSPVVQLRSGGYIVINQAEALVAIDVNSGRATREHHIEDTALKTNGEAAEEIARQLRLRDLAGLIVIDFIDMDETRNNRTVERRLKEALKHDRARIQVGHISHFGLLEMSRQRIRSSVLESSTEKCPACGGTGHIRSVSSVSLQLLRALEETLLKGATHNVVVRTRTDIALYLLNQKRAHLRALEERFQIAIVINADATIGGQVSYVIEKGEQVHTPEQAKAIAAQPVSTTPVLVEEDEDIEVEEEEEEEEESAAADEQMQEADTEGEVAAIPEMRHADVPPAETDGHRRRRRRRGRRGEGREAGDVAPEAVTDLTVHPSNGDDGGAEVQASETGEDSAGLGTAGEARGDGEHRRRRRGRRGGRRTRRDRDAEAPQIASHHVDSDVVAGFEAGLAAPESDGRAYVEPLPEPHEAEASRQPEHARAEEHATNEPPPELAQEPAAAAAAPVQSEASESTPMRRRSTVREPAPLSFSSEPPATPPPTPVYVVPTEPSQPAAADANQNGDSARPRRSGWWSRRMLGKS